MLQSYRDLAKTTLIYSIGPLVQMAMGVCLVPLYTSRLPAGDYGAYETINRLNYLLGTVTGFGLSVSLLRVYFDFDSDEKRGAVFSTGLLFLLASSVLIAALIPFSSVIARRLLFSEQYAGAVLLAFVVAMSDRLFASGTHYFRVRNEPWRFLGISLAAGVSTVCLNLYFVWHRGMGLTGILLANSIVSAGAALLLLAFLFRRVGTRWSPAALRGLLTMGLPLVPSGVLFFLFSYSDRFLLPRMVGAGGEGLRQVGVYGLGVMFAGLVGTLIMGPFMKVYIPFIMEVRERPDADQIYGRLPVYVGLPVVFGSLGVAACAPELVAVFARSSEYYDASVAIPLVVLGTLFMSLAALYETAIYLEKRTNVKPWVMAGTAAVALVSYAVLIPVAERLLPRRGWIGAGIGYCLACGSYLVATVRAAQKVRRIPYEHVRVAGMVGVACLFFVGSWAVNGDVRLQLSRLTAKVLWILLFPVALCAVRVLRPEEIAAVRRLMVPRFREWITHLGVRRRGKM